MGNYHLYRFGHFLAKVLPMGLSTTLVMWLCDVHFCISPNDRRAVEKNLKIVCKRERIFPHEVREVFRNFGKYLLEFFTLQRLLGPEFVKTRVDFKNIQYLSEVLQKGRGGIIVSAHIGNWELGGAVLPFLGFPLSVVALAHKDPRVNALFNAQREAFGAKVIQADVAVRRVMEHLHKNRLVAILADRDFGGGGFEMDFLGHKSIIPKGAAFFSMRTGAPIIPLFFRRGSGGSFEVTAYPPIDPPHPVNGRVTDPELKDYIQKYLPVIESEITRDPCQWLLFREFNLS
jgi:KDO2-lipid IV(A) lauroyltransferase